MCFLCTLGVGGVVAWLAVFLAIDVDNLFLAGVDAKLGEVYRVCTHIGDASVLIQMLCHHHGLRHGEAQFAGGFLLQGRGGEWRCRSALEWLLAHGRDGELGVFAFVEECQCLFMRLEACVEFRLDFRDGAVGIVEREDGVHPEERFTVEVLYFAFAFDDESHGHALHTSG